MATGKFYWRTSPTGTEGTNTVYVDSAMGSDIQGDGTRSNPYQSLGRAYRGGGTKPTNIICRGRFSEQMQDGNHTCNLNGDFYGAAVFDGADKYLIYGFRHSNMVIINTGLGDYSMTGVSGSVVLAGVGSAYVASVVGHAHSVSGVGGSPVLLDRTALYYGVVGGNTSVRHLCVSRPKNNGTHLISLGGYTSSIALSNGTVYGVDVKDRQKKQSSSNYKIQIVSTIFSDFAMIANDLPIVYTDCLFASDAKWYYFEGTKGTSIVHELEVTGETSQEMEESLINSLTAKYDEFNVAESSRYFPTFTNCLFSKQTYKELFNDAEHCDFTLKLNSDGIKNEYLYYGAFPPSLHIPILTNSNGCPETWDEYTCDGCITIDNNAICLDETSQSDYGSIFSKIIKINPSNQQINGIYSLLIRKFSDYHLYANNVTCTGDSYIAGDILPIGRYIVKGAIIYNDTPISNNNIVVVLEDGTTFSNDNYESSLISIEDPNIQDVIYVRARAMIYKYIKSSDGLERGGVYYNSGDKNIIYRNRTIVPKESFVAVNNDDIFICEDDENYEVGIIFDDTRVPSAEWVPAQTYGEYFVCKQSGVIKLDNKGVPVSSGNPLSYQSLSDGGYKDILKKSILNQKYLQFALNVKKYDHITE